MHEAYLGYVLDIVQYGDRLLLYINGIQVWEEMYPQNRSEESLLQLGRELVDLIERIKVYS